MTPLNGNVMTKTEVGLMTCTSCGHVSPINRVCLGCGAQWGRDKSDLFIISAQNDTFTWFIIHGKGCGFHNNEHGWLQHAKHASRFRVQELIRLYLPIANWGEYGSDITILPLRGNYNKIEEEQS